MSRTGEVLWLALATLLPIGALLARRIPARIMLRYAALWALIIAGLAAGVWLIGGFLAQTAAVMI